MSFPFTFNPITGLNDTTQFPDDDPQIRVHLQNLLNQTRDFINTDIQNQLNLIPYNSTYRQAIINGNFDIWQRGTSFTGFGYIADRWFANYNGTISKTYSQQSFTPGQTQVPNNPKYFLRTQVTSASGQTIHSIGQRIEDVNTFSGMQVSVSFYAKADTVRTLNANFNQEFGTGGSATITIGSDVPFNLTTDWQKFTATFTIPSISGKTIGTNSSLLFYFGLPINIASTIDIAQVQINAGATLLPFIPKSFQQELQDCKRYFEKSYDYATAPGTATNSAQHTTGATDAYNFANPSETYKVTKRIVPTLTVYSTATGASGYIRNNSSNTDISAISFPVNENSKDKAWFYSNTGGLNTGYQYLWHWTADAEL